MAGWIVEEHLLYDRTPVEGSFEDFVFTFDSRTGHVLEASTRGKLAMQVRIGFFETEVEAEIEARLDTIREAGFAPRAVAFGYEIFRYCEELGRNCLAIEPTPLDPVTGYVNAIGVLRARSGPVTTRSLSVLGEAIFEEWHEGP